MGRVPSRANTIKLVRRRAGGGPRGCFTLLDLEKKVGGGMGREDVGEEPVQRALPVPFTFFGQLGFHNEVIQGRDVIICAI
uniref:Uncharacterized protein n=1 Tax=Oryza rufipogon TaxID=4529 RepID=A0A0E0RB71_ORYRU